MTKSDIEVEDTSVNGEEKSIKIDVRSLLDLSLVISFFGSHEYNYNYDDVDRDFFWKRAVKDSEFELEMPWDVNQKEVIDFIVNLKRHVELFYSIYMPYMKESGAYDSALKVFSEVLDAQESVKQG